jgi:two-component system response regulator MprA
MTPQPNRVLLVEASHDRQLDLMWRLERAGFFVRVEPDVAQALDVAALFRPDIALIGGLSSRTSALAILPQLERDHDIPVIVLRHANPERDDPLPADTDPDDDPVVRRIEATLESTHHSRSTTLAAGDIVVDPSSHVALRADHVLDLTQTEFDLLQLLLRHRNQVLSKDALVSTVFTDRPVTPNTVEVHVANLRRKLEAVGPRIIHTVRRAGYVLRAPAADPYEARRRRLAADHERLVREGDATVARSDHLQRDRPTSPEQGRPPAPEPAR